MGGDVSAVAASTTCKFITKNFAVDPVPTPSRTCSRCVLTVTTAYTKGDSRRVSRTWMTALPALSMPDSHGSGIEQHDSCRLIRREELLKGVNIAMLKLSIWPHFEMYPFWEQTYNESMSSETWP
jgi:hypothetical protein